MQVVLIGAGRMGSGLAFNWLEAGHEVLYVDPQSAFSAELDASGAKSLDSVAELVARAEAPRVVWLMLPSGPITAEIIDTLSQVLDSGDLVIDGGNSFFETSVATAKSFERSGIGYIDVGTSGGILGRELGYCMTVGGHASEISRIAPLLESGSGPADWVHVGDTGSGHYAKMVHNGIEYALMQAYSEGAEILATSNYSYDLGDLFRAWSRGSLIESVLLSLLSESVGDGRFSEFNEEVEDLGTGRWATLQAIHQDVPAPVITAALQSRLYSRRQDNLGWRLLSSLRYHFGGHVAKGTKNSRIDVR